MNRNFLYAIAFLLLGVGAAWLIIRDAAEDQDKLVEAPKEKSSTEHLLSPNSDLPKNLGTRKKRKLTVDDILAIPNERIVRFANEAAYRDALARLKNSDFKLLGQLDRFRALRIGGTDFSNLKDLLGEDTNGSSNYLVSLPLVPDTSTISNGAGFGSSALDFLNVGDNAAWGEGVTVAIIDTGITSHIALPEGIRQITVSGVSADDAIHGHGQAVTSLIVGQHSRIPGVAPSSTAISIRVADSGGSSNSFLLAEGISAAVDAGAQVINISMGSYGDSQLVREAISYAQASGAVIVASAGNEGFPTAAYPAAYDGVISVGAIDAAATQMNFSNQSDNLSITAPGYEAVAAWTDDSAISFTGTSASAPFVSGTLAAIISESSVPINGAQAGEILLQYTNEAGAPGHDSSYGNGYLDIGRVMERDTPGITDLALAGYYYEFDQFSESGNGLQITVENQGYETVFGSQLSVDVDGANYPIRIPQLAANERHVVNLPVGQTALQQDGLLPVIGVLTYLGETVDAQPANNHRAETITSPTTSGNGP
ncbi:S8 family serine peptidase [Akkermansiaceae bacterium]|nr:S8 family serine peptidase [Akkermansiaceae bacterium]MDB4307311.1 S8 family serine peptidase [Akkermansiaceae bacterium]MDB4693059.1 S8 family serine peptidase [Akkermansiaceae bacterium]